MRKKWHVDYLAIFKKYLLITYRC
ncbi:hypothetical protein NVIE_1518 [Nitrososphaera viennensis EN76]|uniref:Uncharacterized protein n=1 Tax=Nitrososphaera viennensis EN76 TaxID=926571 RepID=A0A060HRB3_9ARCH|nr:hypothetical protein NVIE_1518 [Nitrososphaera viennensis EN76]